MARFASTVTPPIVCTHPDDVAEVHVESEHCLFVRFFDGTSGLVDMSSLVTSPNAGVFAVLADPERFANVRIELGAVTRQDGLDLAPDTMYQAFHNAPIWKVE
jgi:hypothetical protein